MSDILTRLLLDSKGFDNNLSRSRKSVSSFEKSMLGMASKAGKALVSFGAAAGLAMGGMEVFNKTIAGSQTLTDAMGETLESATSASNTFFASLAKGDFSNFTSNIQEAIQLARDYYREIDTLGSMSLFQDNSVARVQNQMAKDRNIIKDKSSSQADISAAQSRLKASEKELEVLTTAFMQQAEKAYIAAIRKSVVEQGGASMSDDAILKEFGSFKDYNKNVEDFKIIEAKRMAAGRTEQWSQTGEKYYKYKSNDATKAITNDPEYKRLRAIAELHDDNIKSAKAYERIALSAQSQLIAAQGANIKGFNKGVDAQPKAITKTEPEVKFNVHYTEVDELLNPKGRLQTMSRDGVIIPVSFNIDEGNVFEEDFAIQTKNTFDYIDSLYGVANAMSAISNATSEGGASWVSYSAGVVGSVAAMLPALASLLGIESALGIAEQAKIPFPFNIVAMAATGAGLAASIAALPKFESGGLVPGISYSGDKVLARVNSGEMILNKSQQSNLFNLLDGGVNMGGYSGSDKVEFVIRGRNLEGIMNKNARIKRRIR